MRFSLVSYQRNLFGGVQEIQLAYSMPHHEEGLMLTIQILFFCFNLKKLYVKSKIDKLNFKFQTFNWKKVTMFKKVISK